VGVVLGPSRPRGGRRLPRTSWRQVVRGRRRVRVASAQRCGRTVPRHRRELTIRLRDRDDVHLTARDMFVVLKGIEHELVANDTCCIVLLQASEGSGTPVRLRVISPLKTPGSSWLCCLNGRCAQGCHRVAGPLGRPTSWTGSAASFRRHALIPQLIATLEPIRRRSHPAASSVVRAGSGPRVRTRCHGRVMDLSPAMDRKDRGTKRLERISVAVHRLLPRSG
jgi:hypothetical protein